jgi:hypothetical protein
MNLRKEVTNMVESNKVNYTCLKCAGATQQSHGLYCTLARKPGNGTKTYTQQEVSGMVKQAIQELSTMTDGIHRDILEYMFTDIFGPDIVDYDRHDVDVKGYCNACSLEFIEKIDSEAVRSDQVSCPRCSGEVYGYSVLD